MSTYVEARDVATAVAAMAAGARPIAGGTDLVVGARHGKSPLPEALVGIHRIAELSTIEHAADGSVRIGALVTHAQLLADPVVAQRLPGLQDASAIVGSHATRANGTLGGNVMNASPAMDTGAPLLCHGARAVLVGPQGTRSLGLDELWTAPGRISASPDELLVAIEIPAAAAGGTEASAYVRLQYRRQMEIAVVGAGAWVQLSPDGATVQQARVAITALSPVICRVTAAEQALAGAGGGDLDAAVRAAGEAAAAASRPISDVRASAEYRRAMAAVVTRRAVQAAIRRATGEQVAVPASDWSVVR
ncbi:MAG: FAD binding domain-containing protein [Kineosporiaceae bacterium]|nr:FAD binding domain-containing protein [Kineosporiaceae bacterium]MBK7621537.1 FAD binding domain-containing protein [Kineosporiaceae bacterium]MBK8077300.1 FAD binding domain-containing protein [Kineosporiaceae bacterium]